MFQALCAHHQEVKIVLYSNWLYNTAIPALGPTQPPVKWVPDLSRGIVRPEPAASV